MNRSPLALVMGGIFVEFTCWKLMSPLLPLWASRLGAAPLMVGVLLTAFSAAELSCTPVLGALSDRFGRRPVVVTSLAVATISFAMIASARSLPVLLVAQAVGGFGTAILSVGQAAVADWAPPGRLAHAMAYLAAAIGAAHAAGPALAGVLSAFGPTAPFWTAAALSAGNTVLIGALLPETKPRSRAAHPGAPKLRWRDLLRSRWIQRLAVTTVIFGSVLVTLEAVLPLFTYRVLHWAEAPNAWLFAYLGVAMVTVQLGVVGRSASRTDERRLLLGGLAVAATGLIVVGLGSTPAPVIVGVGLVGIGAGLVIPLVPTLFSLASPVESRGAVLGFAQGLFALARLVAPLSATGMFTRSVGAPFVVVGALCLVGAAVLSVGNTPAIDTEGGR